MPGIPRPRDADSREFLANLRERMTAVEQEAKNNNSKKHEPRGAQRTQGFFLPPCSLCSLWFNGFRNPRRARQLIEVTTAKKRNPREFTGGFSCIRLRALRREPATEFRNLRTEIPGQRELFAAIGHEREIACATGVQLADNVTVHDHRSMNPDEPRRVELLLKRRERSTHRVDLSRRVKAHVVAERLEPGHLGDIQEQDAAPGTDDDTIEVGRRLCCGLRR